MVGIRLNHEKGTSVPKEQMTGNKAASAAESETEPPFSQMGDAIIYIYYRTPFAEKKGTVGDRFNMHLN